ncbi:MAG: baseplate assembly protein [Paracoccaceae bacterium]
MTIDITRLPPPRVLTPVPLAQLQAELRALVVAMQPDLAERLEDPNDFLVGILDVAAAWTAQTMARADDEARACMVAFASGSDLDHLAVLLGVERLVVDPGDAAAVPPVPPRLEDDEALRRRVLLAPEGFTTAGSAGMYLARALEADGRVRDASVTSPGPGLVDVHLLAHGGDGTADAATVGAVAAHLDAVRPMSDLVRVLPATIEPYRIEAVLTLYPGPTAGEVRDAALAAARAHRDALHGAGRDVTMSGIYAALHRPGVQRVELIAPAADLVVPSSAAPWCPDGDIEVTVAQARDV